MQPEKSQLQESFEPGEVQEQGNIVKRRWGVKNILSQGKNFGQNIARKSVSLAKNEKVQKVTTTVVSTAIEVAVMEHESIARKVVIRSAKAMSGDFAKVAVPAIINNPKVQDAAKSAGNAIASSPHVKKAKRYIGRKIILPILIIFVILKVSFLLGLFLVK